MIRALGFLFGAYAVALVTSMSGMEIFGWLTALTALGYKLARKEKFALPFLWRPILAFGVVVAAGILWGDADTSQKLYDLGRLRFYALYVGLYWAIEMLVPSARLEGKSLPVARPLAIACAVVAVYGTVQHFISFDLLRPEGKKVLLFAIQDEKIGPLVVGAFNHHLTFSNIFYFYAALFTAVGLLTRRRPMLGLGLWLFLLCIWTGSRIAWAAVPVGLAIICAGRSWKWAAGALAGVALLFILFFQIDPGFRERTRRTWMQPTELYSGLPRERLWAAQKEMFLDHPWLGVGWNNNERKSKEYVDRLFPGPGNFYGHAHSAFFQVLASTGVLGCLTYLWIWITLFVGLVQSYRRESGLPRALALGLFAGFVGFQIQGLTQWNFGDAEVLHNVLFLWALTSALKSSPACFRSPAQV